MWRVLDLKDTCSVCPHQRDDNSTVLSFMCVGEAESLKATFLWQPHLDLWEVLKLQNVSTEQDTLCEAESRSWLCWVGGRFAVDATAKKLSRGQLQAQSVAKVVTGSAAPQGV